MSLSALLALWLVAAGPEPEPAPAPAPRPFAIRVVDDATGRGVPLVELETVHHLRFVTDSAGVVAFAEPGLMDQAVFFHVRSHGYEFPKDGFGYRGKALEVTPGGSATLKVRRVNVAERLYRVTGAGIYRDSVLVGDRPPIAEPLLDAQVMGQDSVINAVYRGRLHWFWGDTNRPGYPLGNFHVPGATSRLPADGGLDPDRGVDLAYFADEKGFARPTAKFAGDGPTWVFGLASLQGRDGKERMFGHYVKVRPPLSVYAHGLAEWDDAAQTFRDAVRFAEGAPFYPSGQTFTRREGDANYIYYCMPFPLIRVRAEPEALADLARYEAFTPLKPGTKSDKPELERDDQGRPRYGWKAGAPLLDQAAQDRLIEQKTLDPSFALLPLRDIESGKRVLAHGGSVNWNAHRRRWVMIAVEVFGTSMLGEVWYAEADRPLGPWAYARKVVTHDKYSFYNPKQHPYFDRDGGRTIFFEGTYTSTFSGNEYPTPLYDYNQVMYKLDLDDPRLALPVAVERIAAEGGPERFGTAHREAPAGARRSVAFFAPDRPRPGTVPVYEDAESGALTLDRPAGADPLFHALPADAADPPPGTALLRVVTEGGRRTYRVGDGEGSPLVRVWVHPSPGLDLPRD